jgi:hypothetical protein
MRFLYFALIVLLLVGCSNGQIELRKIDNSHQREAYLVNTSKNKIYTFTIKRDYPVERTELHSLYPGEEIYLGMKFSPSGEVYHYDVVGEMEGKHKK